MKNPRKPSPSQTQPITAAALAYRLEWFRQASAWLDDQTRPFPSVQLLVDGPLLFPVLTLNTGGHPDGRATVKVTLPSKEAATGARTPRELDDVVWACLDAHRWFGGSLGLKRSAGREHDERRDYLCLFANDERVQVKRIMGDAGRGRFQPHGYNHYHYYLASMRPSRAIEELRDEGKLSVTPTRGRRYALLHALRYFDGSYVEAQLPLSRDEYEHLLLTTYRLIDAFRRRLGVLKDEAGEA